MHFTTQDGYTFSSQATCDGYDSRWVDSEDLSFSDMCDGSEPLLGTFADDDLLEYAWTEEADNGDLIVHWDLNSCDGSEIVAQHYPEFDYESEAIFDECDGNLSATYKRFDHETVLFNRLFGAIATVIEMQTTSPLCAAAQ